LQTLHRAPSHVPGIFPLTPAAQVKQALEQAALTQQYPSVQNPETH
jgi:hypothetical protein